FLPSASLAAVLVVALVFGLFGGRTRLRNYVVAAVLGAQAMQAWSGAEYRWDPRPWGGAWLRVSVPPELSSENNLYLTIGLQSNAFLIPYLPENSAFVNFAGGYALSADGRGGARVDDLIRRYSPNVRVLVRGDRLHEDHELRMPTRTLVDNALERFGLHADTNDCATITVLGLPPPLELQIVHHGTPIGPPRSPDTSQFVTCRAAPDATIARVALEARRLAVDGVLNNL